MQNDEVRSSSISQPSTATSLLDSGLKPRQANSGPLLGEEFCSLLKQDIGGARIRLRLQNGSFVELCDPDVPDQRLVHEPGISLAQILQQQRLTPKMKINLAYTIARSVWQYYDSDWMGSGWTSRNIHFMLERSKRSDHSYVNSSAPCLAAEFQNTQDTIPVYHGISHLIHRYPRVLFLGMLLIDIAHSSYEDEIMDANQTQQYKANKDYLKGLDILKNDSQWPALGTDDAARSDVRGAYRAATESCFDLKIFKSDTTSSSSSIADVGVKEHREILYERVVWPLEEIIADMRWTESLSELNAIEMNLASAQDLIKSRRLDPVPLYEAASRVSLPKGSGVRKASSRSRRTVNSAYHDSALFDDEIQSDDGTGKG